MVSDDAGWLVIMLDVDSMQWYHVAWNIALLCGIVRYDTV